MDTTYPPTGHLAFFDAARARRDVRRWPMLVTIVLAAAVHIPVIAPHLEEAPYMGALFILLTVACLVLAAALVVWDAGIVYLLSVITCGLAVIGYIATRATAFPHLADDVGNWFEPLGVVAVLTEATTVALAAGVLLRPRRRVRTSSR